MSDASWIRYAVSYSSHVNNRYVPKFDGGSRDAERCTDFETSLSSCCAYHTDNFYPHAIGLRIYGKECTVLVGYTTSSHNVISLRSPKASWGTKAL